MIYASSFRSSKMGGASSRLWYKDETGRWMRRLGPGPGRKKPDDWKCAECFDCSIKVDNLEWGKAFFVEDNPREYGFLIDENCCIVWGSTNRTQWTTTVSDNLSFGISEKSINLGIDSGIIFMTYVRIFIN